MQKNSTGGYPDILAFFILPCVYARLCWGKKKKVSITVIIVEIKLRGEPLYFADSIQKMELVCLDQIFCEAFESGESLGTLKMSHVISSSLLGRLFFGIHLLSLVAFYQCICVHRTGVTEAGILLLLEQVQFSFVQLKDMYRHHEQGDWPGNLTNIQKTSNESFRLISLKQNNSSALNLSLYA